MNLRTFRKYLRFSSFDTSTELGRADERYRLAVLTMAANVFSRGAAMVVMIFSVSLTTSYLGPERFGVWMTIASFVGMLGFLDLGIGNSLTNKVSQVAATDDPDALRTSISGGLGLLFVLACGIGLVLLLVGHELPWTRLLKIQNLDLIQEVSGAAAVFSLLFAFSIFTNGIQRIFFGLQRAFESHFINFIGSILSLLALWIATKYQSGIPSLLLATLGVQSLAVSMLLLVLIKRRLFTFSGIKKNIRFESHSLLKVGGLFFILQIGTMVGWGADSLIIASFLGVKQVAAFAIVQRLFQFITQPMAIMNAPLWSAYADAKARGDLVFIKKTIRSSLLVTFAYASFFSALLVLSGEYIVDAWTKNSITISMGLLLAYGIWVVIEATGNAFAMFLNGCGLIRQQVISSTLLTIVAVFVKIYLVMHYGLMEMIFGYVLVYLVISFIVYGIFFKKRLAMEVGVHVA